MTDRDRRSRNERQVWTDLGREFVVVNGVVAWRVVDEEKAVALPKEILASWLDPEEELDLFDLVSPIELEKATGPCLVPGPSKSLVDTRVLREFHGGFWGPPAGRPAENPWAACLRVGPISGFVTAHSPDPIGGDGSPGTLSIERGEGSFLRPGKKAWLTLSHPSGFGKPQRLPVRVGDGDEVAVAAASLRPGGKKLVAMKNTGGADVKVRRASASMVWGGVMRYLVVVIEADR